MSAEKPESNDNREIVERATDPDRRYARELLEEVLERLIGEGIDPQIIRERLLDMLMKPCLPANPYRDPMDVAAVKSDLWFLYEVDSRVSFQIEQLEKALARAGTTP